MAGPPTTRTRSGAQRVGATFLLPSLLLSAACTVGPADAGADRSTGTDDPSPAAVAVPAGLEPFYEQELDWGRCEGRSVTLECASLTVPVDYDEPDGARLDVALMRSGATRPDPVGHLVVDVGGPGLAILDAPWFPPVSAGLRTTFDVVGFDPRGTGRSAGLSCLDPEPRRTLESLDRTPDTPDEVEAFEAGGRTYAEACEEAADGLLPFLGTEQVVQDLDVLRAALGEAELHYVGASYGTLLGGEYAARFPDRVGRMALLSPVPAGRLDPLDWLHDRAVNAEADLDRAIDWCLATVPECPLGVDRDDARDRLEAYLTGLDERPVEVEGALLTRERALSGIEGGLGGGPDGWGDLRRALEAAYRGTPVFLSGLAESDGYWWPDAWQAATCLDRPSGAAAVDGHALAERWDADAPVFGAALAWGAATLCDGWPTGSFEPAPRPVDVELLLVHSEGDPWSPPADADRVAEELAGAHRLAYGGPEHISYGASPCVRDAVDRYLTEGRGPGGGTCPDATTG